MTSTERLGGVARPDVLGRGALRGAWRVLRTLKIAIDAHAVARRGRPPPRARARNLQQVARAVCAINGFDVQVTGKVPRRPAILVANHLSYIDPLAIAGLTPCAPIAKAEIDGWPILGSAVRALGVIFFERGSVASGAVVLRRTRDLLEAGVSVLVFPEGTTSHGRTLQPFHRGMFDLAMITGAAIVPVAIRYDSDAPHWVGDASLLPHYLRMSAAARTVVHVEFGAPIEASAHRSSGSLAAATRAELRERLGLTRAVRPERPGEAGRTERRRATG